MTTTDPLVDDYLAAHPEPIRAMLAAIRARVHALAPEGVETISYRMPAVKVGGRILCYWGGFTAHVSMFPVPPGSPADEKLLAPYVAGKGTLRFAADEPLPVSVVDTVVRLHLDRVRAAGAGRGAGRRR